MLMLLLLLLLLAMVASVDLMDWLSSLALRLSLLETQIAVLVATFTVFFFSFGRR